MGHSVGILGDAAGSELLITSSSICEAATASERKQPPELSAQQQLLPR